MTRCALFPIIAGGLLTMGIATAQESIQLDEAVTWLPSAQRLDLSVLDPLDGLTPPTDDDDLVVLYRRIDYRLTDDAVHRSSTRIYKFNSEEAIRDYGTLRVNFDAASDTIDITRAMVVDSNGDAHLVEPATVQIVPSDSFNVFSDFRYVVLPMTGVDVGSIAVVAENVTTDRSKEIAPWGAVLYEQYSVPQGKIDISMTWDTPELKPQWKSEIEGMTCSETGTSSLHCSVTDVPGYPLDDDVFFDDEAPQFVAAKRMSWDGIAGWYLQLFNSAVSGAPSVVAKAAELSDGLEDETEILKAVHEFVSNQVRYVGLEHGDSSHVPHSSDVTLKRRYGDCKDKAALLIDLLHHSGIDMSPVLVATTRRDPDKLIVPSSRYFDHLIVCGELSNGEHYCVDGTDPYTGIDQLSSWTQGAVALQVNENTVPSVLPADEYRYTIIEDLRLAITESGELQENGTLNYRGAHGSNLRGYLAGMSSEELEDWALENYHYSVSEATDPEFRIEGIEEVDDDLAISWDASYEAMVSPREDLLYTENASWLHQAINLVQTQNDEYDYRFPGVSFDSIVTVDVANNWKIDQWSPNIAMQSRFGRLERGLESYGQELTIRTRFEAPAAVIPVDNIEDFIHFLEIIQTEDSWRISGTLR